MATNARSIGIWGAVPAVTAYLAPKVLRLDRWALQQQANLRVIRLALKDASGEAKSEGAREIRRKADSRS